MLASRPARGGAEISRAEKFAALQSAMSQNVLLNALKKRGPFARQDDIEVLGCQLVRVHARGVDGFVLEYELRVNGPTGEWSQTILGELVGRRAREHCAISIRRLSKPRRAQLTPDTAAELVWSIPELGLVMRYPGLDERLEGLRLAHNPTFAAGVLTRALRMEERPVTRIETEILGHRLGKRCVARFRYATDEEDAAPDSVVVKLYKMRTDRGRRVCETMRSLRKRGFGGDDSIRVPRPIGYLDPWRALLMEDVPGVALPWLEDAELTHGITAAGRALAKLHGTVLAVKDRYNVDDEIELLRRWVILIDGVFPDLGAATTDALIRVVTELDACRQFEPTLVHRDFYEKQALSAHGDTVLIDFDTLCLADPALDVGNFLAHLKLNCLQGIIDRDDAESLFLEGYRRSRNRRFMTRVSTYTRASMLRLACLYAFWPRWRDVCAPLLDAVHRD